MFWKGGLSVKMNKNHWYARFLRGTKGVFRGNPVLGAGLALPFVVVAASSLQTAVGLSIGALLTMLPVGLLMPLIMQKIPEQFRWLDYPLCALIAALFLMPTRVMVGAISPALMDSVGVYFSLLCVSTLLFASRAMTVEEQRLEKVLLELVRLWLGLTMVLLLVGICREVLGNGTLWGKPLTWMKIRFSAVMVSGLGFILLGFIAALGQKIHRSVLFVCLWIGKNGRTVKNKIVHFGERPPKENKNKISGEIPEETADHEQIPEGKEQE